MKPSPPKALVRGGIRLKEEGADMLLAPTGPGFQSLPCVVNLTKDKDLQVFSAQKPEGQMYPKRASNPTGHLRSIRGVPERESERGGWVGPADTQV